jgi:hypothetical protein
LSSAVIAVAVLSLVVCVLAVGDGTGDAEKYQKASAIMTTAPMMYHIVFEEFVVWSIIVSIRDY